MGDLHAFGITVDLPHGWDGRIYRHAPVPRGPCVGAAAAAAEVTDLATDEGTVQPVAHLANFPLPADRGDYGSGAVERMGPVTCSSASWSSTRRPRTAACSRTRAFPVSSAAALPPTRCSGRSRAARRPGLLPRMGRAFCAYAVLGATATVPLTPRVNDLLATVRIEDPGHSR